MSCTCVIHAVMREEPPGDQCPVHPIRWVSVKSLADELAAAREAGRLAALDEAARIVMEHPSFMASEVAAMIRKRAAGEEA